MEKNNTAENVRNSVSALYKQLLDKRHQEAEEKEEAKRAEKEAKREKEMEEETKPDGTKMTKKEKRQAELDNWKEIVVGLTGDDLEYTSKKQKKKKYKKWIDDEDENSVTAIKPKKVKKRNYNKEFEPELNMLRTLIADQNKFTADLQKRFMNAAGPATKDAMIPNKTMVELASAIMSGRSNSLGMLREVGSIKKTIADLYMKQKKLDSELAGGVTDSTDLGLFGSNIASTLFNTGIDAPMGTPTPQPTSSIQTPQSATQTMQSPETIIQAEVFDPSTWEGPAMVSDYTKFENTPHEVVVKQDQNGYRRFAAIREDNGEELIGCPVPTVDPNKLTYNEKDNVIRGPFDEVFKVISE